MKKIVILFFVFSLISIIGYSKSFNFLSSSKAIRVSYVAKEEGYKNIHLLGVDNNEGIDSIPLKLSMKIGGEVLVDYFIFSGAINKDIKTLYLYEGDSVSIELNILSPASIEIENIKGNLKFSDSMVINAESNQTSKSFTGEYWDVKKSLMFRFEKYDSIQVIARLSVSFNGNYPFDKFHYQINVIRPDSSFYSVEGSILVNKKETLSFAPVELPLIQEVGVFKQGKYIIEVVPMMGVQRINGVKSIGFQLVNIKH